MMNGTIHINTVFGKNIKAGDSKTSDPYVKLTFPDDKKIESKTIYKTCNPIWNEKFQ